MELDSVLSAMGPTWLLPFHYCTVLHDSLVTVQPGPGARMSPACIPFPTRPISKTSG